MNTELLFPFPLPFNLSGRFQVERPAPKLNRWESSETEYTLTTLAPGITEENIVLESHNKKLLLKIEGSNEFGLMSRQNQWTLPSDADTSNIEASLSRGVLTVSIKRIPEVQAERIAIKNLDQTALQNNSDPQSDSAE